MDGSCDAPLGLCHLFCFSKPRATLVSSLPWAGLSQAVGLKNLLALHDEKMAWDYEANWETHFKHSERYFGTVNGILTSGDGISTRGVDIRVGPRLVKRWVATLLFPTARPRAGVLLILYHEAKARREVPMTKLASELIREGLRVLDCKRKPRKDGRPAIPQCYLI